MACFSSPPRPPPRSSAAAAQQTPRDHILNMSPRPSHHLNPSSSDLVKEIAKLDVEIARLERYLLSLYRTSFQQNLPSNLGSHGTHIQQITGVHSCHASDQSSQITKSEMDKEYYEHPGCTSPTSSRAALNDLVQFDTPKSSAERERKSAYLRRRSLADHIGNSCFDNNYILPDKLSEDILRCICTIYCKLGKPTRSHKEYSVSSNSSLCSSSTFSPRNLAGSWSSQCTDEASDRCSVEFLKQDNGPYAAMVEILKICLDDESYSYAATMLRKFRSLVKRLENVDLKKMRREQKLAFWINIHNALTMHAYLAYGTRNLNRSSFIAKSAYNVGGICINAYDIQSNILGIKSHYSASRLQTLLSPKKKFKTKTIKHAHAIEYPEPLVHFALCSGAHSDPAIRVYSAKNVFQDLNVAKEEFIQATVYVHKENKIYLPKILHYYSKDMSLNMAALLKVVSKCLPGVQQKAIDRLLKGRREKCVHWLEENSSFRYLIHRETAETTLG